MKNKVVVERDLQRERGQGTETPELLRMENQKQRSEKRQRNTDEVKGTEDSEVIKIVVLERQRGRGRRKNRNIERNLRTETKKGPSGTFTRKRKMGGYFHR